MSDVAALFRALIELRQEVAELKRQAARNQFGTVCDRDPVKGFRVQVGVDDDGQPKKTAWLPHPDQGGEGRSWAPLSIGQTVMVMTPHGDPRKAAVIRCGFNGEFEPPSQSLDEHSYEFGKAKIILRKEEAEMFFDRAFAKLLADKARVGVKWPSGFSTDIEVTENNVVFTIRDPQGQIVRQRTIA